MITRKLTSSFALAGLLFLCTSIECRALDVRDLAFSPASGEIMLNGVDYTHGIVKWVHGAFVYWAGGQTLPTFLVLSPEGERISSFTPNIPGSVRVFVNDFDRAPDGSVVFSGSSYSAEGQHVPFLCWISANGKTSHVVRTAPYFPYGLSVALDGSVWTSGFEMINGDINAPGMNPDAGVIRHFNPSGKLVDSLGSRKQFGTVRLWQASLVATEDRIGWYAQGLDGVSQYVEISLPAMTLQTYPGLPAQTLGKPAGMVERFVLTAAGKAFVNFVHRDPHNRLTYQFDRETKQWVPMKVPAIARAAQPHLKGSDGERLVFMSENSAMFLNPVLSTK